MSPKSGIRIFNYGDAQSIVRSKTDYDQQAGFRTPATPMPKPVLGTEPVGAWDKEGGRPYVRTLGIK
jgi:hypothetical protein